MRTPFTVFTSRPQFNYTNRKIIVCSYCRADCFIRTFSQLQKFKFVYAFHYTLCIRYVFYLQCFKAIKDHIESDSTMVPLLLVGGPGSGKSTILAKWYELVNKCCYKWYMGGWPVTSFCIVKTIIAACQYESESGCCNGWACVTVSMRILYWLPNERLINFSILKLFLSIVW